MIIICFFYSLSEGQVPFTKRIFLNRENTGLIFTKVLKDHSGFLWFGSSAGLYRYDGTDETLYSFPALTFDNTVSALFEDHEGVIWIGYKSGQVAFLKQNTLKLFTPHESLPRKSINAISEDSNKNLWIATAGEGVYYFNKSMLYNINADDGLNDNFTYTLLPDIHGNMWVGTDEGIALCKPDQKNKILKTLHKNEGLPDNIVRVIADDGNHNLWIGLQQGGICRYMVNENKFIMPAPVQKWKGGQVNSITIISDDLWVGTEENGLAHIDLLKNSNPEMYSTFNSLQFSRVMDAVADMEGNIWMIANMNVYQSSANRIMMLNKSGHTDLRMIHTIFADHKGTIWFTPDQGLIAYNPEDSSSDKIKKYTLTPPGELMDIVSLYEDECHYIWAGTMGAGLFRLNPENGVIQKITGNIKLTNASVLAICGNGNEIWVATLSGALKINLPDDCNSDHIIPAFENSENEAIPNSGYLYDVFEDSKKRIWLATDGKGILCYEQGKLHNFSNVLRSNIIYSVTEDEYGNIWFSTFNGGIYKYDGNKFKNYGIEEGLRSLAISGITSDHKGNIVVIHNHGFDVLDIQSENFVYNGSEYGLADLNADLNSICTDKFGNVWMGTDDGIIRYRDDGGKFLKKPETFITGVSLLTRDAKKKISNQLAYNENNISFDFTGRWYNNPERVLYRYMLEGYNNTWINTGDRRIIFPSLSPGKYIFRVRTSLNKNFRVYSEASFSFSIGLPFWRESWFIFFVILVLIALIYFITRFRISQIRKLESLKKEKIEFQFETLKNQVNPHFLFNSFNTLISTIEEDQQKAVEYVETLSAFFRNIVSYKDHDLISLNEELDIASVYFLLQQKRYGSNLKLNVDADDLHRIKKIPPMVLQMLIENAVNHNEISAGTQLIINIQARENRLVVMNNINRKRKDNGTTGTGLQNIINRFKLLTDIAVVIEKKESSFIVIIPLL